MAKLLCFGFNPKDEESDTVHQLNVDFEVKDPHDGIKFLTALSAFVQAYDAGKVLFGDDALTVVREAVVAGVSSAFSDAAKAPEPTKPRAARARATTPPALQAVPADPPANVDAVGLDSEPPPPPPPPEVTETVVPPRAAAAPKAGSAPPAAKVSAVVSSPSPAPAAPTPAPREAVKRVTNTVPKAAAGPSIAPSAVAPVPTPASAPALEEIPEPLPVDEIPAELRAVKSFRQALDHMYRSMGLTTHTALLEACYKYAGVPCIARYLQPNPDPELGIEMRITRALQVYGAETAA
jgi:hypothetical protein